jgi:acetyl esterase/lipase
MTRQLKYCIVIVLCLAFSLQSALNIQAQTAAKSSNLIINGGFEAGISNWGTWNNPVISNTDVYEGSSAVQMNEKGSIGQFVTVKPLTTYLVSAYAKVNNSAAKLVFAVRDFGIVDVKDTEYSLQTIKFTTNENTSSVEVYFWLPPNDGVGASLSAFVDAVEFVELDESSQFNVTDRAPLESTKVGTTDSLTLTFNKDIALSTSSEIDVYINKVQANETCTWKVSSPNTLSVHPNADWPQGSLLSLIIKPTATSANEISFNGTVSEFEYIVDTENDFGFERIEIPSLLTRNNGAHNIPLKVALPTDRSHSVPVQFWVHGGGWSGGTATDSWAFHGPHSEYLAEELGIATLEIAYRCLGSGGTFDQAMEDIDAAYQWAVENAEKYNLDLRYSFFSGGSAGTPLSSLAAQRYPLVRAYVGFNGMYNFVDNPGSSFPAPNIYGYCTPTCEANSAIFNLRENPPATLLLHGDQDGTINPTQSSLFADAIVNAGGTARAIIYQGESHAFFNQGKVQYEDCLYEMAEFLKSHDIIQSEKTAIEESGKMQNIEIWPNPVSDRLTIQIPTQEGKTSLEIYDSSGRTVQSQKFYARANDQFVLPVSDLSEGIYLLSFQDARGTNFYSKFVVISQ